MWIRSQDRKILATANNLYIRAIAKGYAICSDKCDLGKYSSEEKAMKARARARARAARKIRDAA